MKSQPHRNATPRPDIGRFYETTDVTRGPSLRTDRRHRPPAVRYQRYPALSDDDQPLISVRLLALLLLVAIVVALALGA